MLTRWAAWPREIRWLAGGIAAVALVFVVAWVLFVPVADWLADHDVGTVTGALHETALDNARGRLLTLGAGLLAAGALAFTALNFNLLRRNSEQADLWQRRIHELTEQGQVTDRYTKAIEQLGSDKLDVRIGGIYALERVARDSARDHPTVMEVLAAFIREHSREACPPRDPNDQARSLRPDLQAALSVVGRANPRHDIPPCIDLNRADLTRADLSGADLRGAILIRTILAGARLNRADLRHAILAGADLRGAYLQGADLEGAELSGADLTDANLLGVTWPADVTPPQGWKRTSGGLLPGRTGSRASRAD